MPPDPPSTTPSPSPRPTFYSTRPTPTLEPTLPAPPPRLPLTFPSRAQGETIRHYTRATTRLSPASLSTTAHRLAEADARANFVAHSALGLGRRGGSPFRLRLRALRIREIRRPLPEADARIRLAACAGNPEGRASSGRVNRWGATDLKPNLRADRQGRFDIRLD